MLGPSPYRDKPVTQPGGASQYARRLSTHPQRRVWFLQRGWFNDDVLKVEEPSVMGGRLATPQGDQAV